MQGSLFATYRVGVIGCGSMAHGHAAAFRELDDIELVCCADISEEAVERFRRRFNIPFGYTDYRAMLEQERPDFVSIVTWPSLHAEMVIAAANAGVKGILCEKPMTLTLEDADRMIEACRASGTLLVVNHQRRWGALYETARDLLAEGVVGTVLEMQTTHFGADLLTDATHMIDLFRFYNGDRPIEWVMAQVTATGRERYGHLVEDCALVYFKFENDVRAMLATGRIPTPSFEKGPPLGRPTPYCAARIVGTDGVLEVSGDREEPPLVYVLNTDRGGWRAIAPRETTKLSAMARSIARMIECVENGETEHRNAASHARASLEVVLAAFLSAKERRPVHLPLEHVGFPLADLSPSA